MGNRTLNSSANIRQIKMDFLRQQLIMIRTSLDGETSGKVFNG
jgi:hypothetical protein